MTIYQFHKIKNHNISFSSNFPLGSGKCIHLSKKIIKVNPIKDPVTNKYTIGYDYYFNFYIKNHSNKKKKHFDLCFKR